MGAGTRDCRGDLPHNLFSHSTSRIWTVGEDRMASLLNVQETPYVSFVNLQESPTAFKRRSSISATISQMSQSRDASPWNPKNEDNLFAEAIK